MSGHAVSPRRAAKPLCFAIVIVSIAAGACASIIQSSPIGTAGSSATPGLVYSLPKAQIQIAAQRKMITPEDVAKALKAAETSDAAVTNGTAALKEANSALERNTGARDNATDQAAKDRLAKQVDIDAAVVRYLTIKLAADKLVSEEAKRRTTDLKAGQWLETATVTVLPAVADPTERYVAKLDHRPTRDDNLKLTVTNGLLSASSATSVDQTPSIAVSLAGAVSLGLTGIPQLPTTTFLNTLKSTPPNEMTPGCQAYQFSEIFDPTDLNETATVMRSLASQTQNIYLRVDDFSCRAPGNMCFSPEHEKSLKQRTIPPRPGENNGRVVPNRPVANSSVGLFYRVPRPVHVSIVPPIQLQLKGETSCVGPAPTAQSIVAVVPDSLTRFALDAKAGAFTASTFGFTFKDGMPIEYSTAQPSEIAAAASIPVNVAKAIVSIPAEILQLKVNYNNQAQALIEARTKELEAQLDLLNAEKALAAARTSNEMEPAPETPDVVN